MEYSEMRFTVFCFPPAIYNSTRFNIYLMYVHMTLQYIGVFTYILSAVFVYKFSQSGLCDSLCSIENKIGMNINQYLCDRPALHLRGSQRDRNVSMTGDRTHI